MSSDAPAPPPPGAAQQVHPGVLRVLAPNPSPMTHWGTNSYVLGEEARVVIDPGPDDPAHLRALLAAAGGPGRIAAILVTHAHLDHSALAPRLSHETGAPVIAFGPPEAGRSAMMQELAEAGMARGGEGVDLSFAPAREAAHGEVLEIAGLRIEALWTPGHFCNHLSFAACGALFSGDQVMGWATSLVSPPDGDIAAYMASCRALQERAEEVFLPGHGAPITDPGGRLAWLIAHREEREAQILEALRARPGTARDLAARIYADIPPQMLGAAARNVLAHLLDLAGRGLARPDGPLSAEALFAPG